MPKVENGHMAMVVPISKKNFLFIRKLHGHLARYMIQHVSKTSTLEYSVKLLPSSPLERVETRKYKISTMYKVAKDAKF